MTFPGYDEEWEEHLKGDGTVHLSLGPFVVWGGDEKYVFRQHRDFEFYRQLSHAYVFLGLDRGDIGEAPVLEIHDERGIPITKPISPHKEWPGNFDAYQRIEFDRDRPTPILRLVTVARCTGPNWLLPQEEFTEGTPRHEPGRLSIRPHWGLWLYFR